MGVVCTNGKTPWFSWRDIFEIVVHPRALERFGSAQRTLHRGLHIGEEHVTKANFPDLITAAE